VKRGVLVGLLALLLVGVGGVVWGSSYTKTKRELKKTQKQLSYYNRELGRLERVIEQKIKNINWLNNRLKYLDRQIRRLTLQLKDSNEQLNRLERERGNLQLTIKKIESELIQFLSKFYYITNQKEVESLPDLINTEIYDQISKMYARKVGILIQERKMLEGDIEKINRKIAEIVQKRELLKLRQQKYRRLQKKREKELAELKQKQQEYWEKISQLKKQEAQLQQLLAQLKIVKSGANQSSYTPHKFRGLRFVPPVHGVVVQRFGSYIDPIYKIRIYNNSIKIKTAPYAKVRAVERGIVVYAGEHDGKKMIFIKHPDGVFSIYSNLYALAPGIQKGSRVRRGQIIARVKDSLQFAMSYREKYINPLKLIRIPK
jgi:murein DD-endopeptidase MepM/ murein hydrolase activator NlpD